MRTIFLDDSYYMITSDNDREIVAREIVMFLHKSDAARLADDRKAPVVSKALARRRRQIAAVSI